MSKAVIFDVDGTFVDSVDHNARNWQDAFRDHGHEVAFEDIRGQIGKGGDQLLPAFLDPERSKPHPDIFLAALRWFDGVQPEDVLVAGDTPHDAEAAGTVGLRAIGLLCGGFPEQGLRDAGCIAIHRSPAGLLAPYDRSPVGRNGTAS